MSAQWPPHTPPPAGDLAATVRSVQTVDACLAELLAIADEVNARYLVTSDHGNADDMVQRDKKGKPLVGAECGVCVCAFACAHARVCVRVRVRVRTCPGG